MHFLYILALIEPNKYMSDISKKHDNAFTGSLSNLD